MITDIGTAVSLIIQGYLHANPKCNLNEVIDEVVCEVNEWADKLGKTAANYCSSDHLVHALLEREWLEDAIELLREHRTP